MAMPAASAASITAWSFIEPPGWATAVVVLYSIDGAAVNFRPNLEIRDVCFADPHAPPEVRGTAPLVNQTGFYSAFDVKPGDKMYLAPAGRVTIW